MSLAVALPTAAELISRALEKYDPGQDRDREGRWTDGDPLDVADSLIGSPDLFLGSARVGSDPNGTGVNIVATEYGGDIYYTITTGTPAEARQGDGHADDFSILADEQIRKLQPKLKKAIAAADNGQPFASKLGGEDNGDVVIGAKDGKVTVSARSWGWDEQEEEEEEALRPPLQSREDFEAEKDPDDDEPYTYEQYLADHAAGVFDYELPEPTPPSWKVAELTVSQAQQLLTDVKRLAAARSSESLAPGRLLEKYNPLQPRDPGGEDGGQWVKSPGSAVSAALDKLKLGKRAPAGFTVRSSKKLKTDYADVGVAEVDGPDGPQVRIGVIGNESGKWDAGFVSESRKTQLREEIARKQSLMDSDSDDVDDDIEDQIIELESEFEDLDNERTAVITPEAMSDLRRQLDGALTLAKANKAKIDADVKAQDAIDAKRDALIAEHSDADLERRISRASWDLRSAQKTVKALEHDLVHGSRHGWDPEFTAERLASWKANVVEYEAELAPLLARRAELMPPDARARLEDLDRQYAALNDADIDDLLTTAEVSAPNGSRVVAEIWGSDDIDEQWVSTRLYVLASGEATDDIDDDYASFRGLKGLNKLIAGFDTSRSPESINQYHLGVHSLDRLLEKYDPTQARDDDGRWSKIGMLKRALNALTRDEDTSDANSGVVTFADREGAEPGRFAMWERESNTPGSNFTVTLAHNADSDDEEVIYISAAEGELRDLNYDLGLALLRADPPPIAPDDPRSQALHAMLLSSSTVGAAKSFGDDGEEGYIDISRDGEGFYLEAGDSNSEVITYDLTLAEIRQFQAMLSLTLMQSREEQDVRFGRWSESFDHPSLGVHSMPEYRSLEALAVMSSSPAVQLMMLARVLEARRRSGLDVAAWNAANPLHPKASDGKFTRNPGASLAKAAEKIASAGRPTERKPRRSAVAKALSSGDSSALDGLSRESLRQEAKRRGLDVPRGAHQDVIKDMLWDDENSGGDRADVPDAPEAPKASTKADKPESVFGQIASSHKAMQDAARDRALARRAGKRNDRVEDLAVISGHADIWGAIRKAREEEGERAPLESSRPAKPFKPVRKPKRPTRQERAADLAAISGGEDIWAKMRQADAEQHKANAAAKVKASAVTASSVRDGLKATTSTTEAEQYLAGLKLSLADLKRIAGELDVPTGGGGKGIRASLVKVFATGRLTTAIFPGLARGHATTA